VQLQRRHWTTTDGLIKTAVLRVFNLLAQHHHNPVIVNVKHIRGRHNAIRVALTQLTICLNPDHVRITYLSRAPAAAPSDDCIIFSFFCRTE
jgi:3-deoxy-D-arabino-heptulosonate 7-phosphate (DAHP) synthase